MSLARAWAALGPQMTRALGATQDHPDRAANVELRRRSTLHDVAGDVQPAEMRVKTAASSGASSLVLELASHGRLKGSLLAGARLVIAGQAYRLTAAATSAGNSITVLISPVLAAEAPAGAVVTMHPEATFTLEGCHVASRMSRDFGQPSDQATVAIIRVPVASAAKAGVEPATDDVLVLEDGLIGTVINIPMANAAFWTLQLGA